MHLLILTSLSINALGITGILINALKLFLKRNFTWCNVRDIEQTCSHPRPTDNWQLEEDWLHPDSAFKSRHVQSIFLRKIIYISVIIILFVGFWWQLAKSCFCTLTPWVLAAHVYTAKRSLMQLQPARHCAAASAGTYFWRMYHKEYISTGLDHLIVDGLSLGEMMKI